MASTQLITGDRHLFSTSKDDIEIMKEIQATHTRDNREVDVKPLLEVVKGILKLSTAGAKQDLQVHMNSVEDMFRNAGFNNMPNSLAHDIHRIFCEISCKCSGTGGDAKAAIMTLFNTLSCYKWDAKVVLALAAFAVNYGEFCLVRQLCTTNCLAKFVSLFKNLPDHTMENSSIFQSFDKLITTMLKTTSCIVEFMGLQNNCTTLETQAFFRAQFHTILAAVYWTIRSVVACATQIVGLTVSGSGYGCTISSTEVSELSNIHDKLRRQLSICQQHIANDCQFWSAYTWIHQNFDTMDTMKIISTFINAKDVLPLFDRDRKNVPIDVLRKKSVLLLFSDLYISKDVLEILQRIFKEPLKEESQYEVLWLPIVDKSTPNDVKKEKFDELVLQMPWYKVCDLSLLDGAAIKYIKEEWHFKKRPLLVVLDAEGKVVCPDAIPMMLIWGRKAFPFSSMREEVLWKEKPWRLVSVEESIGQEITEWIEKEEKYICLYGGEDEKWLEKFRELATAMKENVPLEMVYVGKSKPTKRVDNILKAIQKEKRGHCLQDLNSIKYFWVRLESMWFSKTQCGNTLENDEEMKQIETMLAFNGSDQGWAVIFKGSKQMIKAKGDTLLACFGSWEWGNGDFLSKIDEYIKNHQPAHHCYHIIFSGVNWKIPERMACAECRRPMEKCTMYKCCIDEAAI